MHYVSRSRSVPNQPGPHTHDPEIYNPIVPTPRRGLYRGAAVILLLCLLVLVPARLHAASDQVCQVASGQSIQTQLNDLSCTTIELAAATFTENLTINRSVILQGAGMASTTIDGNAAGRVITIDGAGITVHLRDLRVTGGDASNNTPAVLIHRIGGGILVDNGASLYIERVQVDSNLAFSGPTRGGFGGGIGIYRGSTLHATELSLLENQASGGPGTGFGGGLAVVNASAYLTQTLVYGNVGNYRTGSLSGDGTGGGIYVSGLTGAGQAHLGLWDSTIENNTAANAEGGGDGLGGGLRVGSSEDTQINIYNTRFEGNRATGDNAEGDSGAGGGIAITTGNDNAYVTLTDSVIHANLANVRNDIPSPGANARGGGIYADPLSSSGRIYLNLINTTLTDNIAKAGTGPGNGQGGGIYGRYVTINIEGGLIQGNIAATNNAGLGQGGGIRMSGSNPTHLTLNGVTVLDNIANTGPGGSFPDENGQGGGIQASGNNTVITVTNTIVADNRAAGDSGGTGAGIYVGGSARGVISHTTVAAATLTPAQGIFHLGSGGMDIINTIVANHATGIHNQGATGSVEATYILFSGNTGNTVGSVIGSPQTTGNADFVNPAQRDYHIQSTSDAIDTGTDAGINVDIDGDLRPAGAGFDIGADEYTIVAPAAVTIGGPGSVLAGETYTYTAQVSPPNAQTPLTYTWDPAPASQTGNQAAYTWPTAGTEIISVTVENDAGSATATRTITVGTQPITLTAVSISGPTSGTVNQDYDFIAQVSPADASSPITYTWTPAPDSGQNTETATYQWSEPGVKTITATAQNPTGIATATHTITISQIAVTNVSISGPSSGTPNVIYTYNAAVSPSDASTPINYTWTPEPLSGQGTSQASYSWPTVGDKTIEVEAANAGGSATATRTVSIETPGVTDVSISGPSTILVNAAVAYQANVSPANATPPIDYTWSPGPTSGQNTAEAIYSFATPGTRVISVTASNLGGSAVAVGTRTITVVAEAIPVTGAQISGPTQLVVDNVYDYTGTVSPANATGPITYTWSPEPLSGQGTANAAYSWSSAGPRTITFTAQNSGGTAVATRTLNVNAEPIAVTGVTIEGPTTGRVDTTYTFTAVVSPADAVEPIAYTWTPTPLSGQGTAQATYRWDSTGTKNIAVTAENEAGSANDSQNIAIEEVSNEVEVRNDFFSPQELTIEVGETVTWRRLEGVHNVRADDGSFGNNLNGTWTTYSHTFTTPGVYPYYCEAHGGPGGVGMSGVIRVIDPNAPEPSLFAPFVTRN